MKDDFPPSILRRGVVDQSTRLLGNDNRKTNIALAEEVALSLNYNGISHSVMMVTPCDLTNFILGFSLTSGIINHPRELHNVVFSEHDEHINADIEITNRAFWALKSKRRHLAGTSGCGLCGVEALDMAMPELAALTPATLPEASQLTGVRESIAQAQVLARESGAMHAALYLTFNNEVVICREDIGRHNAFDKLIGAVLSSTMQRADAIVVLTSRCSVELVQKAVMAKLPILVTLSSPTDLSVKWARRYGLTLIHLPKCDMPRLYTPQ